MIAELTSSGRSSPPPSTEVIAASSRSAAGHARTEQYPCQNLPDDCRLAASTGQRTGRRGNHDYQCDVTDKGHAHCLPSRRPRVQLRYYID